MPNDLTTLILDQVKRALKEKQALSIHGSGSCDFLQPEYKETLHLDMSQHSGILDYQPTELNIKARAGTPIVEIQQALAEQHQRLPTDFPSYAETTTLGGAIAIGHTGPTRPFQFAIRDHVLGASLIDGRAEILHCGGQVMKNVAGYDVSRLLTGSRGTLGPILDLTIKVLPIAEQSITLCLELDENEAIQQMNHLAGLSLPLAATLFYQRTLYIRLEGTSSGLQHARQKIGGELLENAETFWQQIIRHQHEFFQQSTALWRVIVPTAQASFKLEHQQDSMIDWCGGLRWVSADTVTQQDKESIAQCGGSFSAFRHQPDDSALICADQITELAQQIQRKVKTAFDPEQRFNPRLSHFFYTAT